MNRSGRPPRGSAHVMSLEGSDDEKERLRVLLEATFGEISLRQACEQLGLSEARLHQLRHRALQGALEALEPKPSGRPVVTGLNDPDQVVELRQRIRDLESDLQCALVRTELALSMPQLLVETPRGKKNSRTPTS